MLSIRRSHRPGSATALAVIAVLAVLVSTPSAAEAAGKRIVGLGDSYASGVGTRTYYAESGSCQRSPYAYPVVDAARVGATLSFRACSGATTTSVLNNQLDTLSSSTTHVTLTVGGNDAGFTKVITTCAQPFWASDCDGGIDQAQSFIKNTLPSRLNTLYTAVRSNAPNAKVVIVGYPRIFNGEDCNAGTFFSPAEEARLNATADLLDTTIRGRADAYRFSFADPRSSFAGHAVCDTTEWVNGLSNPVSESYHPNRGGQAGYANLVDNYLT